MEMTVSATISTELRAQPSFIPWCPLCSHVGVADFPDLLRGPSHRMFVNKTGERHALTSCCSLSATDEHFDSQAEAAAWWRDKRQQPLKDMALDNRRRNTIRKLTEKGLEPI